MWWPAGFVTNFRNCAKFIGRQYHIIKAMDYPPSKHTMLRYRILMEQWNDFDLDFPTIGIQTNRPKWFKKKNCFDEPVDTFYPAPGDVERLRRAKAICKECEVRSECLTFALDTNERFGIWGGKSARERSLILRAQRLLARPRDD